MASITVTDNDGKATVVQGDFSEIKIDTGLENPFILHPWRKGLWASLGAAPICGFDTFYLEPDEEIADGQEERRLQLVIDPPDYSDSIAIMEYRTKILRLRLLTGHGMRLAAGDRGEIVYEREQEAKDWEDEHGELPHGGLVAHLDIAVPDYTVAEIEA